MISSLGGLPFLVWRVCPADFVIECLQIMVLGLALWPFSAGGLEAGSLAFYLFPVFRYLL
jgi:hypothetical protein